MERLKPLPRGPGDQSRFSKEVNAKKCSPKKNCRQGGHFPGQIHHEHVFLIQICEKLSTAKHFQYDNQKLLAVWWPNRFESYLRKANFEKSVESIS